jgi:hypothetical protein
MSNDLEWFARELKGFQNGMKYVYKGPWFDPEKRVYFTKERVINSYSLAEIDAERVRLGLNPNNYRFSGDPLYKDLWKPEVGKECQFKYFVDASQTHNIYVTCMVEAIDTKGGWIIEDYKNRLLHKIPATAVREMLKPLKTDEELQKDKEIIELTIMLDNSPRVIVDCAGLAMWLHESGCRVTKGDVV